MRISIVVAFLTITTLQILLASGVSGQNIATEKVTVGLKQESLEAAIHKIEGQTSLRFFYRKADIKGLRNLFLSESTRTIDQVLRILLENSFIGFKQVGGNILLTRSGNEEAYEINGRVLDPSHQPLASASIKLVKKGSEQTIASAAADTGGYFKLSVQGKGEYVVLISAIGSTPVSVGVTLADARKIALPAITVYPAVKQLSEVSIISKKPLVEQKIDRTVVNVDAMISSAGTTALDVLDKSPGVSVNSNGTISLKGKSGVVVFIDDKPTNLSGDDLQNYLRAMPSGTLDQVELMTNPPAKYDAAGNAGVINIKTKKNRAAGFNGNLSLAYGQGKKSKTNNSLVFNYRTKALNVFGTLGYNIQTNFNNLDIYRRYKNDDGSSAGFFDQHTDLQIARHSFTPKVGVDFYASDNTTLGVVLTGMTQPSTNNFNINSRLSNGAHQLDSTIIAHNRENNSFTKKGLNLNYRHSFDKNGTELTADGDYISYFSDVAQTFANKTYSTANDLLNQDEFTGKLPSHIHIYSFNTDFSRPMANGIKFMAGLKASMIKTDNIADYENIGPSGPTPDYDLSNHFIYKENINAAYINFNKDYKQLSVQAGLRTEHTVSKGHQLGNAMKPDSAFSRSYTGLFPTLYFSYKLDSAGDNQLGLNAGRRIDRPAYRDLNPFVSPLDKFTYYVGNPFLNPSYSNTLELSHTYKNRVTTTLSIAKTKDDVEETIEINNGIYYSRPGNIGTTTAEALSVDATVDLAKWVSFHFFGQATHAVYKSAFYNGQLHTAGNDLYVKPSLQFSIGKSWNAQLDGAYQSKLTATQFVLGSYKYLNAGVSKKLSTATTIKVSVNDIFYTRVNEGKINNLVATDASYHNLSDSRFATLSFSYRFGKTISNNRKHEAKGSESEQNRVKQ